MSHRLMAAAMAAAAIVSWVGAWLADRPGLDAAAAATAQRIALMLAFGACGALAAWAYLHTRGTAARLAGAVIIHVAAALALPLTSNDVFSNLAYGRLAQLGTNPYLAGPAALPAGDPFAALVSARWAHAPSVYGPIATLVDTAVVQGGVWRSLVAFKLVLLACSLGIAAIAWRCCKDRPERAMLVAWNPLLAWEVSAQAHNDGLLVLALAAGVWAGTRKRDVLAAVLLAVAVLAKLAAAPVLALHLWGMLRRTPGRAVLAAALVGALTGACFAIYWTGPATLNGLILAVRGEAGRTARSVADLACMLARPFGGEPIVHRMCWAAGIAAVAWIAARALPRVRTFEDAAHHALLILLTWMLTTPWFQPWYAVWLLPLAMIERDARLRRIVAGYTALLVVQYALPVDPVTHVAINAWVVWKLRSAVLET